MKILSVYQAYTKDENGDLPKCDVVSEGVREDWCTLFEAAPDLLAALEAILADEDLIYTGGGYASLEKAGMDNTDKLAALARAAVNKAKGVKDVR